MKGNKMKFDLIVKDLTQEEVSSIIAKLTPTKLTQTAVNVMVDAGHSSLPTPVVPPMPSFPAPVADLDAPEAGEQASDGSGVDAEGMYWDERVHASTKTKTAKGVWKRKRGVQDVEYESVKAQQLSTAPAPVAPAPVAPAPVAPAPAPVAPAPAPAPVAPAPVAPAPVAPAPAPAPVARDMNQLFSRIQQGFTAGRCQPNYVMDLVARLNAQYGIALSQLPDITGQQHLIDCAHYFMDQDGL
jgi:pyruvate/2-oxoglutarate dehydrogenase complex dihydrolipoamide acyltransferase (E2) component